MTDLAEQVRVLREALREAQGFIAQYTSHTFESPANALVDRIEKILWKTTPDNPTDKPA